MKHFILLENFYDKYQYNRFVLQPYRHDQKIAQFAYASADMINSAIENALSARKQWEAKPIADRAQIFLKAADILAGEKRSEILAATMAGQVLIY